MLKILFYSVILSVLTSACSDNADKKPLIRKVMTVEIKNNGAWDKFSKADETPKKCQEFVLTEDDVREYFQLAQVTMEQKYSHDQSMSRCFAEGELTLPAKYKGKWRIDRARRGILMVEDDQSYFFYCSKCIGGQYVKAKRYPNEPNTE